MSCSEGGIKAQSLVENLESLLLPFQLAENRSCIRAGEIAHRIEAESLLISSLISEDFSLTRGLGFFLVLPCARRLPQSCQSLLILVSARG